MATDQEAFYNLVNAGIQEGVAQLVNGLIAGGFISMEDLNDAVKQELQQISPETMNGVYYEMSSADTSHLKNKSAYMIGVIRSHKKKSAVDQAVAEYGANADHLISYNRNVDPATALGPNPEAVKAVLLRTGMHLDITPGQRQLGPPPYWKGDKPPGKGCEVFLGGLLRESFEDSLVPMLEECGQIYTLRIMMTPEGENKGFAFCVFSSKQEAQKAVQTLDGKQLNKSRQLKVNVHSPNVRLFVGGVDKRRNKDEIFAALSAVTEGVCDVILKPDVNGPMLHRGFVFVDYDSHKQASNALRKLGLPTTKVFNKNLYAEWAEPEAEVSEEVMATVKVLYVTGVAPSVTEEMLRDRFSPYGEIDNVKKLKDYAFIHFARREDALQAMNDLNGQRLEESVIEVTLAKPITATQKKMHQDRGPRGGMRGGHPPMGMSRGGPRGGFRGRGGLSPGRGMMPARHDPYVVEERAPMPYRGRGARGGPPPMRGAHGGLPSPRGGAVMRGRRPPVAAIGIYDEYRPVPARPAPRYSDPYDDLYSAPPIRRRSVDRYSADPYGEAAYREDPYYAAPPAMPRSHAMPRGARPGMPPMGGVKRPAPGSYRAQGYEDEYATAGAPSAYPNVYGERNANGAGPEAKKTKGILDWDVKPIAQQPLRPAAAGDAYGSARAGGADAWYHDTW